MKTHLTTDRYQSVRLAYLEWFERYLDERGYRDTDIWRSLQVNLSHREADRTEAPT
jgi:hypothetical protein